MGREAEPTAVAEAEADPYYGSYGYGGLSYGGYGRSYGGYGRSYGLSSYGGYGRSYGGYGGYGRGYYGKREAEAAPEAEADAYYGYGYGRSYGGYGSYGRS